MNKIFLLRMIGVLASGFVLGACTDQSDTNGSSGSGQGQAGSLATMTILQNELHILHDNKISSFDITSDELSPAEIGESQLSSGTAETLFSFGSEHVFVGTTNGVIIQQHKGIESSDSSRFTHVNTVTHITARDPVVAKDNYAFFTTRDGNEDLASEADVVGLIDIEDMENATVIFRFADLKEPIGLGWWKEALYVCDANDGLTKFTLEEVNLADTNQLDRNGVPILTDQLGPGLVRQELRDFYPCSDVVATKEILILTSSEGINQLRMTDGTLEVISSINQQ